MRKYKHKLPRTAQELQALIEDARRESYSIGFEAGQKQMGEQLYAAQQQRQRDDEVQRKELEIEKIKWQNRALCLVHQLNDVAGQFAQQVMHK